MDAEADGQRDFILSVESAFDQKLGRRFLQQLCADEEQKAAVREGADKRCYVDLNKVDPELISVLYKMVYTYICDLRSE